MGNSDYGTTYIRVGVDDGEGNPNASPTGTCAESNTESTRPRKALRGGIQPRSWSRYPVFVGDYRQKLTNLLEIDF